MSMGILGDIYAVALDKTGGAPLYGKFFEARDYKGEKEVGIAVAVFSGMCLTMVGPLWYVQLTNLVKNTTTYARFARKPHSASNSSLSPIDVPSTSIFSSPSETRSMLLQQDDAEWTHFFSGTSLVKSLSFREKIQIVQRKTCCGICVEEEVRAKERDSKEKIVMEEGEMKERKDG